MKKLTIFDKETGELVENKEFSGGYNITYTNLEDSGNLKHIRKLDNGKYDEKHWIKNYIYRPIAIKLVQKFDELDHIRPESILFIEDTEWEPKDLTKHQWVARIKQANKELESMTGYEYVMELREFYTRNMTAEQVIALIYHELRHIDLDGRIIEHDIEDWENMIATLGVDWNTTRAEIPNILSEDFNEWDELRRAGTQISIFDKKVAAGGGK